MTFVLFALKSGDRFCNVDLMIISFSEGDAAGEGGREGWERRTEERRRRKKGGGSAECRYMTRRGVRPLLFLEFNLINSRET